MRDPRHWRRTWTLAVAAAAAMSATPTARAAVRGATAAGTWRMGRNGNAGQLPATGSDAHGNNWMAYQPSYLQCQSNLPVYGQTANLTVNGQQPTSNNNAARVDDKTGELVIDMQAGTLTVTRRVLIDADAGGVRVTDVLKNPTATDQPATVALSTSTFSIQQSQTVTDPRRPGKAMAWVASVPVGPGRAAVDCYAGPGARVSPEISSQPGNNQATATFQTNVPANGQVAFVHYHLVTNSVEQGTAWVAAMRPSKLLADLPKDVRRSIVNFRVAGGLLGDQEVLRGDLLDVVELRNGDKLNGTLTDTSYKLDTFYGTVELPVDHVVGIVNAGAYRPRQLLVTTDGQIFGGHLQQPTLGLELTSGQKVAIPLGQVARVGYRHRPAEGDDTAAADPSAGLRPPYLLLATGDRIGVKLPDHPVTVQTRYGPLSLATDVLAGITFAGEDSGVHTVTLTDGSHFAGLVTVPDFEAVLATGSGPPTTVKFPVGSLARIVFAGDDPGDAPAPAAEDAPSLRLRKDDLLVGTLTGRLKVDTAFDTVTVDAAEIRSLARGGTTPPICRSPPGTAPSSTARCRTRRWRAT